MCIKMHSSYSSIKLWSNLVKFDQSFHWFKDAIIFLQIGYKLYLDLYKPSICSKNGRFPFRSGFRPLYKSIKLWSNFESLFYSDVMEWSKIKTDAKYTLNSFFFFFC